MTPKEKASEIINIYIEIMPILHNQTGKTIMMHSKQCSLIAVEEIVNNQLEIAKDLGEDYKTTGNYEYWQQVITEIEKL